MGDWTIFYTALMLIGATGVVAAIFSTPIERQMQKVEEQACGHNSH